MSGYLEKGIRTPMAQGRSTKFLSTIKWIRASRLSIKKSLPPAARGAGALEKEVRELRIEANTIFIYSLRACITFN